MHKYLPKFYIFLDQYKDEIFENNNTNMGVIYRNYNASKRETELIKIAKACKEKRYQLFVSNDIKLALKVRADGIYIPSFNKTKKFFNLEKKILQFWAQHITKKKLGKKFHKNAGQYFFLLFFM